MVTEEEQLIMNMDVDSNEGAGEEDEEFYENIEAPKFVDLTTPDHRRPDDDRYWFCLRVGCDQKHEEELDSEAIYKNFVLRVMAARSPNVKLQKALSRTASSKYMKCPGSAPPKPSRSRLSRLAVISSISGKLVDNKGSVKPVSKLTTTPTPKAKTKQVAAEYLTTPRNKKCLPNPSSFRSVQNPKPTALAVPKDRPVAKALFFHSPKKGIAVKTSVELRTPLTKLCDGMKRLELRSQRKQRLGSSSKSAKDPGLGSDKSLPVNSSRKPRVTFEDQRSEKTPLKSQARSAREIKSSRSMKSQAKGKLTKQCRSKEIDSKLREANEDHSGANMAQHISKDRKPEETSSCTPTGTSGLMPPDVSRAVQSSSTSEHTEVGRNDIQIAEVPNRKEEDCVEGNAPDNNTKADLENGIICEDAENQTSDRTVNESEVKDSDDKENVSAFDKNSGLNHDINETRKRGMQEPPGKIKKAAEVSEKILKEGTTMKFRKPKPTTNPKPFRFRTDERGILKEANLEKKAPLVALKKGGSAKGSGLVDGNPHRKHEKTIHGNEKPAQDQDKCNNEMPENSQIESQRTILGDLVKDTRMRINNPGRQEAPESPSITSPLNINCRPCSETSSRKMMKSHLKSVVQPQRLASSRKGLSSCLTPGQQLSVIKETSSLALKPKRKGNRDENTVSTAKGKATGSMPFQRRRPVTIPKEPNFQSTHRPRSCTKQIA